MPTPLHPAISGPRAHRSARPLVAALAMAMALALVAAACAADGDDAVLPFADVQDSDLVFELDPDDPGRAIFRVTTTIPMICSITWGETEELGNQNNSLSMDGTGIEEHDVILPGAAAGTEYFFTVQGADAHGNLYQSDMLSVIIPATGSAVFELGADTFARAPDGGPDPDTTTTTVDPRSRGENLALGATVIDDDLTTEWSTAGDGDDAFITLDLGESTAIAGVEFITRSMADRSAITDTYTVSVDGQMFGPFVAGTPGAPVFAALDGIPGRMVRFDVESSTGGNTGAVEIRILAPVN